MDQQIEIFCQSLTPELAQVYVRAERPSQTGEFEIDGQLYGPLIASHRTLPTRVELTDLGPGETLLARAGVVDPCCWSPKTPALYRASIEVKNSGQVVSSIERKFGLRALAARGRSFVLDGKRWVVRGAACRAAAEEQLDALREQSLTLVVRRPDDALCEAASERGVLIAAVVSGSVDEVLTELRRLARWAAVAFVVLEDDLSGDVILSSAAPNILLAQRLKEGQTELAPWAHFACCDVDQPGDFAQRAAGLSVPVVAWRKGDASLPLNEARSACERLQRDLARYGDYAGYVVEAPREV